jgi:hypothetical protein
MSIMSTKLECTKPCLGRNSHKEYWKLDFFAAVNEGFEYPYICVHNRYKQCVPFKGNESLLRTTNFHKDFPKQVNKQTCVSFKGTLKIEQ